MTGFQKLAVQLSYTGCVFFSEPFSLSNAAMSSVIDTNLPSVGRDQGTKRKQGAPPEGGKENQVSQSSRAKPNKRVRVTEPTEQVSI
jgi:hypothetical protein